MRPPFAAMHRGLMLAVLYFPAMVLAGKLHRPFNNTIPAIFVFGDSTADSGNNNHIITPLQCNFRPYGINFPGHVATGRFSDGRLVTDFIAAYVGVKETVPAYLDPELRTEDLTTGVSFASGGSGFDELTASMFGVITMKRQIEYFKEYTFKLAAKLGRKKTQSMINKSAFIISAGTNDVFLGMFSMPIRAEDVDTYLDKLVENAKEILQGLRKVGAKNIAVVGLSKVGCTPAVVTINPGDGIGERSCNETMSSIALQFNQKLQKALDQMKAQDFKILYIDTYKALEEMVDNPSKFGFINANRGCCGTGLLELTYLCNPFSIICNEPSKYVFFDAVHPSEAAYKNIFKSLRPTIDEAIKLFSN
ncbi:GDSL esterase/lipase At5g45960-like [Salvia miltiorrhiza]|uniref:GDSL esterase/lipase At5g45960-like n=1 Tax=Salvia miltiorrhiza TaxID=226208 RepID=UPI0025ACC7DC|nr:GDSL esterase/lipase At5g45960-like [Salvia miltiorrhiza]